MASTSLQSYIDKAAKDLPAMPGIAQEVMKAINDPNTSGSKLQGIIERDNAITARLLKVANSALYSFGGDIETLGQAIAVLGTRTVRNLVLAASMKGTYRRFGLMEKLLWEHSTVAAPVSIALARIPEIRIDPDLAFTAGLLHDIGKTALANSHREEYEPLVARVYNEQIGFTVAERDAFGFDHAELGAQVVARWKLPEIFQKVIGMHHDPEGVSTLSEDAARLTALIGITDMLLNAEGIGRREPMEVDLPANPFWAILGIPEDRREFVIEVGFDHLRMAKSALS